MNILLFGSGGQVGWELVRTLQPLGSVHAYDFPAADFSRPETLRQMVRGVNPQVIVNAAAHTAVDRAEDEPELSQLINAESPAVLAEEACRTNALLVHYSTDYVFDGTKPDAYSEEDEPNPLGVYGRTKLAGEKAIAASGCRYLIFRTSWVFGARGQNFLKTMLRLAEGRPELRVIDDQHGAPTGSRMLAEATTAVLNRISVMQESAWNTGVYHMTCSGVTSWFGFTRTIFEEACRLGLLKEAVVPKLIPIATHEYPLKAARPANSVLSNEKLRKTFGISMPAWDVCVRQVIDELTLHTEQSRAE